MEEQEKAIERSIKMAKRLKELRKEKGYSYEDVSDLLSNNNGSLSRDSLRNYEVAKENHTKSGSNLAMRADSLLALAQLYHVSTDYLLCETDIRSPEPDVALMVDYLGIGEDSIRFLHALNQRTCVSASSCKNLETSTLSSGSFLPMEKTMELIEVLSYASPGIGKSIVNLIENLISTIAENYFNILKVYNTIEVSSLHLQKKRVEGNRPEDFIPVEAISSLHENGFEVVGSSWILKKSWEDLLSILQTGIEAKIEQELSRGKQVGKYNLGDITPRKLSPQAMESLGINKGHIINAQMNSGKKKRK